MTSYIVPQVIVYQEFITTAEAVSLRLYSFIFGEHYSLFRYADTDEKAKISLGRYARTEQKAYEWPARPVNCEIDQSWVRVFFDNSWLRYAQLLNTAHTIHGVTGYPNRLDFGTLDLATYDDGQTVWPRDAIFKERDVRPGDGVRISYEIGGVTKNIDTRITAMVHTPIASEIHVPTDDENNVPATSATAGIVLSTGTAGLITTSINGSAYDGSADGDIDEVYTIAVATPGAFGVARLTVTSASGRDDVADEIIPVDGTAVSIGTRGLKVTFSTGTGVFESNMVWAASVSQVWAPAVLSSDGNFDGAKSGTYIVTVTKGGKWADSPEVFVTSTGTLDASGPYVVTEGAAFILPTNVELTFETSASSTGLSKGDRYYVAVDAQRDGPVRGVDLLNSLPAEIFADGSSPALDLNVDLTIVKNIEIPQLRAAGVPNWSTTDMELTIYPQITGTDSSWINSSGAMLDMAVVRADIYSQYRALLLKFAEALQELSDVADVESTLGPTVEENPLALGVLKALENSNGVAVKFMATKGTETEDYAYVLDKIYEREDVYGLVPLTHVKECQDLVKAHCLASSEAERGRWRVCWFAAQVEDESSVVTKDEDGNMLLGTILDDPDTVSTAENTRLRCDLAGFIDNGVVGGDIVRALYVVDPVTGEETYEEFVIDRVLTNEEVRLVSGPSAPVSVPSRFEVWHENTRNEQAAAVASFAGNWSHKRVRVVFPDTIGNGGTMMDGMFAACALAGLRSGVNFHQGLTNVEISGFDDVSRTTEDFTGKQLDTMAASGVWIITQDNDGTVYTRHQLTTDMSQLLFREDSMVSNMDELSYYFLFFFRNARYIGRRNITPGLIAQLTADFKGQIQYLKTATDVPSLGPQIIDGSLTSLEVHPTLEDRVVAKVTVELPAPLNVLEIHLIA